MSNAFLLEKPRASYQPVRHHHRNSDLASWEITTPETRSSSAARYRYVSAHWWDLSACWGQNI